MSFNLKNEMISMMTNIGNQVKPMLEKTELYVEAVKADPSTKYRLDFLNALQELGLSNELSIKIALAVKLNINSYDGDISKTFCSEMLLPILKLNLATHLELPLYGGLRQPDMLVAVAQNCELKYNI